MFIVRYPDGRASGDAFVLFPSESEVEKAMAKNKQQLGHRYVDIFRSTVKEMQRVRLGEWVRWGEEGGRELGGRCGVGRELR